MNAWKPKKTAVDYLIDLAHVVAIVAMWLGMFCMMVMC